MDRKKTAIEALSVTSRRQLKRIYKKIKKSMKRGKEAFTELKLDFIPTQEVIASLIEDGFYVEINSGRHNAKRIYLYIDWYQAPVERIQNDEEYELVEEVEDDKKNLQEAIDFWIDPYCGG